MFVTCLLLYYRRDSFSKLPCSKLLLFIHGSVVRIGLLWPVRQLWFAFYCHAVILSASQFDDHDCEMYGQWRMWFACYCHDAIVWIELLWAIFLLLSWRDFFSKLFVWWSWLWNVVWPLYNVICLLLSWRNCFDRVVVASEAIMIGLLLSWRDSRTQQVVCLMIMTVKWNDYWIVMASSAIVICLWRRDYFSKLPCQRSWL